MRKLTPFTRYLNAFSNIHLFLQIRRFLLRLTACLILVLLFSISAIFSFKSAMAQDPSLIQPQKYYKSIEIKYGDTLWDIALEYMGEFYSSPEDYIKEIKYINNLKNDRIIEGRFITIVYFNPKRLD